MPERTLEYDRAAGSWLEALPLGNGRIGVMDWGSFPARLSLNEESVWSGNPGSEEAQRRVGDDEARDLYARARRSALEGRPGDAERHLRAAESGHSQAYLPVGELLIDGDAAVTAHRALALADALHTAGGPGMRAVTFVSAPHDVIVYRLEGGADPTLALETPLRLEGHEATATGERWVLSAPLDVAPSHEPQLPDAVWAENGEDTVRVVVEAGLRRDADATIVVVAIETTYAGLGEDRLLDAGDAVSRASDKTAAALAVSFDELQRTHIASHRELFDRVSIDGSAPGGTISDRLEAARASDRTAAADPDLVPLLFDYGRYLLISASRAPGRLPANLQGVWNDNPRPPWSSAFTTNINVEMNYWAAETANLAELADPLFDLIGALSRSGEKVAASLGARGWAAHHNSDAWGFSSSVGEGGGDPKWAFWPFAGGWLLQHVAEHRAFGSDDDVVSPDVVRGAAEFLLDWLVETPQGLGTAPSTSPENTYIDGDGAERSVGTTSTMDLAIARELLGGVSTGTDELASRARDALSRLPELDDRITADGVMEWDGAHTEADVHHRHLSHLYALHPGSAASDAFERAAAVSLDRRGADSTGWSLAWKMAMWSRLRRSDRLDELIQLFFRDARAGTGQFAGGLYPNLFAAHPPFQIDANYGFVAGIAESLLQSHRGEIDLLPAVPSSLASGSVRGLIARPGVEVDIDWMDGEVAEARLLARPGRDGTVRVRWRERVVDVELRAGTPVIVGREDLAA
jgi:alpha-L-fucosidase 2